MAQQLHLDLVDRSDAQLVEALVTIDQEFDRLNRLVGNLLDAGAPPTESGEPETD